MANVTSKYATRLRRQILIMLITSMAERFFCFGGGVSFCGDKICTIRPQGPGGPARAYRYRLALRRPYRYR